MHELILRARRLVRELRAAFGLVDPCDWCGGYTDPAVGYCRWCS